MSDGFRFQFDIGELQKDLEGIGHQAPLVMARALNRAGTSGRVAITKAIADDIGLQAKYVSRAILIDRANRSQARVSFTISGKRLPLVAFSARGPEPSRGKGKGVSWGIRGRREREEHAFIATMPGGHRGVFKRKGVKRLPILELRGPSIPYVFEKHIAVFRAAAEESLLKNLRSEIAFAKSKAQVNE